MSRAYPDFKAGEGDQGGLHGMSSEWPYIVELDNEGDDPWPVLWTVAGMGQPHPDPQFRDRLFVTDYRKGDRLNEKFWRILVIYSPASEQTIGVWRRSGRFGNESKQLFHSLAHLADDGTVIDARKRIGSTKYKLPVAAAAGVTAEPWLGIHKTASGKPINATEAIDPSTGIIEVNDAILPLQYEITTPQLSVTQIQFIMSYRWCTNNAPWPDRAGMATYEKWSLIFSGFAFDDLVILTGGAGAIWFSQCQTEILYRPLRPKSNPWGWRGVRRYDSYSGDDGRLEDVYDVSVPGQSRLTSQDYVVYEEANFNDLFLGIGRTVPGN